MDGGLHRKLVEESFDIPTIIDSTGKITYVSPSVEHTLGYEPAELIGETGFEYQHPEDREAVANAIERIEEDPERTEIVETRFRHADGSWVWVESTLQNRMADEHIEGILVNSRDISERKQQEQEYQQLAEEYRTLLDTVEDGMFFLNVESKESDYVFRFERLNRAYEEQTGLTTEEVRGKTPTEVFGADLGSRLQSNYHRCAAAREPINYQEEVPVETGARFWQTSLTPVVADGEVTHVVGITRNVTERVKRERQLQNQKEQLEEFASVVSHDLRNPLDVAGTRVELLADEFESEHIEPLEESLDRMEEVISDTLTLARQGQVVADPEPVELRSLVETCWESVATEGADIVIHDAVTISGDWGRLQHVFENLFRNAIEHAGDDVVVSVGQIDDHGIYVEDTGPGIPKDSRDEVFEPGHSSASGGTGFGLTIVRRIAEAHGWNVSITEGTDGGARFEFTDVDIDG